MDTPDQPPPQYAYDVAYSEADGAYVSQCREMPSLMAHGETADAALKELDGVVRDVVVMLEQAGKPWPTQGVPASDDAPAENADKVPVVAGEGVEWIELGDKPSVEPPPVEPPPSRSAQVSAAMAKVRTEQRRSMARRTPYGYRLGHPDGPHENAKRERRPNGRKSTTPDRRPLVENPREVEILDAIIAGMQKHADLPLGKAAHQVAKALRYHEVPNPRGAATWHSGSIKSIYKTAMAHRAKQHNAAHQGVSDGEQDI